MAELSALFPWNIRRINFVFRIPVGAHKITVSYGTSWKSKTILIGYCCLKYLWKKVIFSRVSLQSMTNSWKRRIKHWMRLKGVSTDESTYLSWGATSPCDFQTTKVNMIITSHRLKVVVRVWFSWVGVCLCHDVRVEEMCWVTSSIACHPMQTERVSWMYVF